MRRNSKKDIDKKLVSSSEMKTTKPKNEEGKPKTVPKKGTSSKI